VDALLGDGRRADARLGRPRDLQAASLHVSTREPAAAAARPRVFDPNRTVPDQLLGVFYSDDRYKTNLVLARAGNLVFFVLASMAVWLWARRMLYETRALIAVALFSLQPIP
jgi:hypothetical protein